MKSDVGLVEQSLDDVSISVLGKALERAGVIVIVVVEPYRQALEDAGRKLRRVDAPLFDRVVLEERLIKVLAYEPQGLLLERLRII